MAKSFRNLKLGYASAEKEGASEPELLLDGYLDHSGMIEEALNGSKFLFLGYKGSGKSAVGQHLLLRGARDSQLFVTSTMLSDFPFSDFRKILVGDDETKYPTAWSWILLLHLFASFYQDMGGWNAAGDDFFTAMNTLESLGLLPVNPHAIMTHMSC